MRRTAHLILILTVVCGLALGVTLMGQAKPKDTYILKGAPMGGVKFAHALHVDRAGKKCETCHHPSRPEKALKNAQQACTECHTKPVAAGMKTGVQSAFHNATAKGGTCIDCHLKENTANKKAAPTKCLECHQKANT